MNSLFKILHILGTAFDLLQSMFGSDIKCLSQHLKQKFGGQQSNMGLVSSDYLLPFGIHAAHIVLVSVVQIVHFADQVISFVGKGSQIIFQPSFLSLRVQCSLSHVFKLVIQLSQAMAVTFVLSLKLAKLIIFPQKVGI